MVFKSLSRKENISNKSAKNGLKSFFFPVPSLFRADNREKPPFFEAPPKLFDRGADPALVRRVDSRRGAEWVGERASHAAGTAGPSAM